MDHNVTQKNANPSRLFTDKNDEEDNDCLSRLKRSRRALSVEEEEILNQLDQLSYQPPEHCIHAIMEYGKENRTLPGEDSGRGV